MTRPRTISLALLGTLALAAAAASQVPAACTDCSDHKYWPKDLKLKKAHGGAVTYEGTDRNDELLGHHGSDTLRGGGGSDVLWGDWDPKNQPESQHDVIYGGEGTDFIYGSHGQNTVYAGAGNDVISIHYGRGTLDCGPGNDIYHVARTRKKDYKISKNCEKVEYRGEAKRGPLKPLD